ncbi:uncharacterized protein [Spinacia oleracea]|uniref:Uncharacterized protein isoform X3 n=1 Tax=Spinacia oleracea TaxID=3562 RepID=A0ABM3QN24_SPIOL|nr:uncharacterized protein LOC130460943 isoform X3 [Spinacia oleracea]
MCRLLVVVEFMLLHLLIVQEIYTRRMASCLTSVSSDGIVINMVVGGEVVTLKSIEEGSNLIIAEMPIQVFYILTRKLTSSPQQLVFLPPNHLMYLLCIFGLM